MQKRTKENLNKVRVLIKQGITNQRTIAALLKISLPCVNKLCKQIADEQSRSKPSQNLKASQAKKDKKRQEVAGRMVAEIINEADEDLRAIDTKLLFERLFKDALIELDSRLGEMEVFELKEMVQGFAELFKK